MILFFKPPFFRKKIAATPCECNTNSKYIVIDMFAHVQEFFFWIIFLYICTFNKSDRSVDFFHGRLRHFLFQRWRFRHVLEPIRRLHGQTKVIMQARMPVFIDQMTPWCEVPMENSCRVPRPVCPSIVPFVVVYGLRLERADVCLAQWARAVALEPRVDALDVVTVLAG